MHLTRDRVSQLVESHERWRNQSLNLIASENRLSPVVRRSLDNDLIQRYGDFQGRDLSNRKYRGNKYLEELETQATILASELFDASDVELRALSGHVAGMAVIMGLTSPGDIVLELGSDGGGHRLTAKLAAAPLTSLDVRFLPFDPTSFNIDVLQAVELIRITTPRLIILGSSTFLFPHPVRDIAAATRDMPHTILAYDASHVLGLIAGKRFQDPLREGAQVMFGSTHKTLPGPQGGLILSDDSQLLDQISDALYPPIVTNHHPFRIPALCLALLEMKYWGREYADQTIANAQRFAAEIAARGVPVVKWGDQFTQSHTVVLQVGAFGAGSAVARDLEKANIITTPSNLPTALGQEGIRIGVQEITRLGMRETDMSAVADLVAVAIQKTSSAEKIADEVSALMACFQTVHYTWKPKGESFDTDH